MAPEVPRIPPLQRQSGEMVESPAEISNTRSWGESSQHKRSKSGHEAADVLALESTNATLQERFESKVKDIAELRDHTKVAVLLMDWEKEAEDYLDTKAEIDQLAEVFETKYNYRVWKRSLHTKQGRKPQLQLNEHLASFCNAENGPNALLIIYYAGHGMKNLTPGQLDLVAGNFDKGTKGLSRIVWNKAEAQIQETDADIFLIFDCCYAGVLAKKTRSLWSPRIFEFLGSTQEDSTALSPGKQSFTTALTFALGKLAEDEPNGFTTQQLYQSILSAPDFPRDEQQPCQSERGDKPSLRRLKIAPLPKDIQKLTRTASFTHSDLQEDAEYFLNLQFRFLRTPTVEHIDDLVEQLRALVKDTDLPLHTVEWRGLFSENTFREDFHDVARKVLFKLRRRSLSSKLKLRPMSAQMVIKRTPSFPQGDDQICPVEEVTAVTSAALPEPRVETINLAFQEDGEQTTDSTCTSATFASPLDKRTEMAVPYLKICALLGVGLILMEIRHRMFR